MEHGSSFKALGCVARRAFGLKWNSYTTAYRDPGGRIGMEWNKRWQQDSFTRHEILQQGVCESHPVENASRLLKHLRQSCCETVGKELRQKNQEMLASNLITVLNIKCITVGFPRFRYVHPISPRYTQCFPISISAAVVPTENGTTWKYLGPRCGSWSNPGYINVMAKNGENIL